MPRNPFVPLWAGAAEGGRAPGEGPGFREAGPFPAGDGHAPGKGHAFGRFGLSRVLLIVIRAIRDGVPVGVS